MRFPPEIWSMILHECAFDSLGRLALLSKTMRVLVLEQTIRDFHSRLAQWFDNVHTLLAAMRLCNAAIFGSWAIWFATKADDWSPYSLGFIVPFNKVLIRYLQEYFLDNGYVREDITRSPQSLCELHGPYRQRWHFIHPRRGTRVHILRCTINSPVWAVSTMASSLSFLYFTANTFFCAYPQLLSPRVILLSPAARKQQVLEYLYSKWLPRRYTIGSKHPLVLKRLESVGGIAAIEKDERSHGDGGCLWIPMTVDIFKKPEEAEGGWMAAAIKTLALREFTWRWRTVTDDRSHSIAPVAS